MLLKLKQKNDKTLKDALILHVEYHDGAKEDREGNAIPKQKYVDKVAIGQTIDVPGKIGYAILQTYGDCFEIVDQHDGGRGDVRDTEESRQLRDERIAGLRRAEDRNTADVHVQPRDLAKPGVSVPADKIKDVQDGDNVHDPLADAANPPKPKDQVTADPAYNPYSTVASPASGGVKKDTGALNPPRTK